MGWEDEEKKVGGCREMRTQSAAEQALGERGRAGNEQGKNVTPELAIQACSTNRQR